MKNETLGLLMAFFFVFAMICLSVGWNVYAFKDCKKVGHSTMYCIGRIGK